MRAIFSTTAQLLANTLYQKCKEGASLNDNFDSPKAGLMVSVLAGPVFDNALSVDSLAVAKFIRDHFEDYRSRDNSLYAGVWTDKETGKIYFDLSVNFDQRDRDVALSVARDLKEIAVWDIDNNCEIRV